MRISVARFLPLFTAAAMMAGCASNAGSTVLPRSPDAAPLVTAARTVQQRDSVPITCGTDADDCKKIRLVAPLDFKASPFGGVSLTLSSTKCGHARVRIDPDDGLPLAPATWNSARAGFLPLSFTFSIASMADPCARHDRDSDDDSDRGGPSKHYFVVAIIQKAADGTYTLQTLDGPATSSDDTLTWATPVRAHSMLGTYAFYLARIHSDKDDSSDGHH